MAFQMKSDIDDRGRQRISGPWQTMNTTSLSSRANEYFEQFSQQISNGFEGRDLLKVTWLSVTLFFIVGGYWLLRSLKDPIMSVIDGVDYIPQAKIASLFVVFGLVLIYNKLLDIYPKHQLFYMMGVAYGVIFFIMGLLLLHPTIGLSNTVADPSRPLGWISYCAIESFGSMVVQCYWALVNDSVDTDFAKKHFGVIIAGAQIGSILGPTLATQASVIGIPTLYIGGSLIMFLMVGAMYFYVLNFCQDADEVEETLSEEGFEEKIITTKVTTTKTDSSRGASKDEGIMEGFNLLYNHDYVKGIFAISSFSMVQVTVIDYMMKVLAMQRYTSMYPEDPQAALRAFATFMGYFGQTTNTISFLFSFFGTSLVIKHLGFSYTLLAYPAILLGCTVFVWTMPNIWTVFAVMMVIKGMSYALNNPTKEILYQRTSTSIKFKCKSWIDTFGQRSAKAAGSIVTNQFAHSLSDLNNYGSFVGVLLSLSLLYISRYMGKQFEDLSERGVKVGERDPGELELERLAELEREDTSCGVDEEGQGVPLLSPHKTVGDRTEGEKLERSSPAKVDIR